MNPAGIIASFDTGIVSDDNWACIGMSELPSDQEWTEPQYDDTDWPTAKVGEDTYIIRCLDMYNIDRAITI